MPSSLVEAESKQHGPAAAAAVATMAAAAAVAAAAPACLLARLHLQLPGALQEWLALAAQRASSCVLACAARRTAAATSIGCCALHAVPSSWTAVQQNEE